MKVTVAICTWNRAELLDQTLARMHELQLPESITWELLVVNNNCTDHTDRILVRHDSSLPIVRVFEPNPGLSNARNCAVRHATGDLILWTDDDVLVSPNWVAAHVEAAQRWPDASYFGGTITAWFESTPPGWVKRYLHSLQGPFAIRELGESTRLLNDGETPYGANMAFRKSVQESYLYDSALGRVGDKMVSGDDTAVFAQLQHDGHKGVWVGNASVEHFIPSKRLTTRYVSAFFSGIGQTNVIRGQRAEGPALFGYPVKWTLECVKATVSAFLRSPIKNWAWFRNFKKAAMLRGMIRQYRKQQAG